MRADHRAVPMFHRVLPRSPRWLNSVTVAPRSRTVKHAEVFTISTFVCEQACGALKVSVVRREAGSMSDGWRRWRAPLG
jgi:hypothetical protein